MTLTLEILSPRKAIRPGNVDEVVAPAINGEVGILPRHDRFLSLLRGGKVTYRQGTTLNEVQITGGVMSVDNDKVLLLADSIPDLTA